MSHQLIYDLRRDNLCTHFILPLLKLSKTSFLNSNFVDSYLTPDGDYIVVEIVDTILTPMRRMSGHPAYYGRMITANGNVRLIYRIPSKWYYAVLRFRAGEFSKMPDAAKEAIKRYGILPEDDGRILALTRDKSLKDMWERELGVHLDDSMELLSKPGDESYMDIMADFDKMKTMCNKFGL